VLRPRPYLLSLLALAGSLLVTWAVWDHERMAERSELSAQIDFGLRNVSGRIEQRIAAYEQLLRGVQGLFAASRITDRDTFRNYVQALHLEANFTGIQTVGLVQLVPAADKASHLAAMQQHVAPDYAIHPDGLREVYVPIVQREPFLDAQRNPLGFDVWSDPVRRQALERSRDTGLVSITGHLRLQIETVAEPPPGFILYLPVYAPGAPRGTQAGRRAGIVGWVYVSFRMTDFMNSLYGEQVPGLALSIHDGVEQTEARLIHRSGDVGMREGHSVLSASEYLIIAGRTWTLSMSASPGFKLRHGRDAAWLIAMAGCGLSVLLALLVWVLVTGRSRAMAMAERMTRELRESEQRWAFAVEGAGDGVWDWDLRTGTVVTSARWSEIIGCPGENGISTMDAWKELIHPEDRGRVLAAMQIYLAEGRDSKAHFVVEYRLRCCGGAWVWVLSRGMAIERDGAGRPVRIIGTISDITERKDTEERIRHMAQHDALTDLPNRALFSDRLQLVLAQARRNEERFALIFLDLDNFKPINDTYGHAVGDHLLQQVARRLHGAVRESDTVGRIGGDEFVVLMPGLSEAIDAVALAEKMRKILRQPFQVDGYDLAISCSFGVAVFPEDGQDEIALSKSADEAMYRAKGCGRDNVILAQNVAE
jgi:diguanylate cyclase (GGDEF)-like protein/PAS domain S-box-containing protein